MEAVGTVPNTPVEVLQQVLQGSVLWVNVMTTHLSVYFFRGSSAVTTQLKNAAFLIAQPKLKKNPDTLGRPFLDFSILLSRKMCYYFGIF